MMIVRGLFPVAPAGRIWGGSGFASMTSFGAARKLVGVWPLALLLASVAASFSAEDALVVLPAKFSLSGPQSRQELLVAQIRGKSFTGQLTNDLTFASSDTNIVRIEGGVALPVTNGTATISARRGHRSATAQVKVSGMERPFEWSFRNHVQPVLAKMGCSSGACHGAAAGQNGFKLSLRGYDNEGDFLVLTRLALGRRIVPSDPARSLMLLKPTGAVPHKGGKKFDTDSLEYRILSACIASLPPGPHHHASPIHLFTPLPH